MIGDFSRTKREIFENYLGCGEHYQSFTEVDCSRKKHYCIYKQLKFE